MRDMLRILGARWPLAEVLVAPVRVQGAEAAEEIAAAIHRLNNRADIDLTITPVFRAEAQAGRLPPEHNAPQGSLLILQ